VVAFGAPARESAVRLLKSIKKYMPDIPIALAGMGKKSAARWGKEHPDIPILESDIGPLGLEDVFLDEYDSDIGGRRVKLRAYELSPAEWNAVLYLDADTEMVAPVPYFFQLIEDGFEFVITKDPHLLDTMHAFERRNNKRELAGIQQQVKTLHTLQWNGGVWAFGRNERIRAFFIRWQIEWEVHAQRDQGALVRAMYTDPLKIWLLGNEWNTFKLYSRNITTAGLRHYPGDARRWDGMVPGRIDSPEAWRMVKLHEERRRP
jgi:hypothetical protein